jgi:hypothetical protein
LALVVSFFKPPSIKRDPPGPNPTCPKENGCSDYTPFRNNAWSIPLDNPNVSVRDLNSDECQDCQIRMRQMCLTQMRSDQCEAPSPHKMFVEFENTWSNFGYLAAGLFILYRRPGLLGISVGANLCLMFLFSGWYHATLRPLAQAFDVAWIYGLLLSAIIYGINSLGVMYSKETLTPVPVAILAGVTPFIGLVGAILKYNGHLPLNSDIVAGVLIGILLIPVADILLFDGWFTRLIIKLLPGIHAGGLFGKQPFQGSQKVQYATYIVAPSLFGIAVRLTDGCGKALCYPDSPLQAHAAWHILGALALLMTYNLFAHASNTDEQVFIIP